MQTVIITRDPLDLREWDAFEVDDARDFIMEHFPEGWPETARIYHRVVSQETDVTPTNEEEIDRLAELEGRIFVVVYPAGPVAIIVAIVAIIAVVAVAFLLQPSIPNSSLRLPNQGNRQDSSPNNQLSERTNRPRLNGRIPDIFGQVRSTPDLLGVPYRVYENHQEVEVSYMCIGKGAYDIETIKDGETLVSEIAGTTVEVYAPNTSPNSGDAPQGSIGTPINENVVKVTEISGVNGQTLRPPNADSVSGNSDIKFEYPDTVAIKSSSGVDFTDFFTNSDTLNIVNSDFSMTITPFTETAVSSKFTFAGEVIFEIVDPSNLFAVGDTFTIADAARTDGTNPVDLAGTYTIAQIDVVSKIITLDDPSSINADWLDLDNWTSDETTNDSSDFGATNTTRDINLDGNYTVLSVSSNQIGLSSPAAENSHWNLVDELLDTETPYGSAVLSTSGDKWIGPFFVDVVDLEKLFSNFVAQNGLYKDSGTQQTRFDVTVELEITPVNAAGIVTGAVETFQGTIEGSAKSRDTRAVTIKANPTFSQRMKVRARRVTDSDLDFSGSVIDEIKWQKVYGIAPVLETHFGNITTVQAQTYATTGALSVKERKLNMVVTRKLPTRVSGSTFTTGLTATKSADEIISFLCLDPYIGNRVVDEIDFTSIYDTVSKVKDYFGVDSAAEFSYTFDSDNLSFEETIAAVSEAVHCTAYRQGNLIKTSFEGAVEDSSLIFNHRNKLPGSETRTIRFGNQDEHDGVELEYVNPDDDAIETYYLPRDRSAINPRSVETLGVRTTEQAFHHAWRVWNKIKYQNTIIEFEATQEAALTILKTRILVADNTRPETQDGEVLSQDGLELTLSQKVVFEDMVDYIIFLQHVDGSIENMSVSEGSESNQVLLSAAPRLSLAVDPELYARCTYIITKAADSRDQAFLIVEKDAKDTFTYGLTAINYSSLYYQQDKLELWLAFFETSMVDESPNGREGTAVASASVVPDTIRGRAYLGSSASDYVTLPSFTPPDSYTKMGWIYKTDLITDGHILSSAASDDEVFHINTSGDLTSGHSGLLEAVQSSWDNSSTWVHATVTYDAASTTMKLFIDGALVDTNESVAQRSLGDLTAMGNDGGSGMIGRTDDIRLYKDALTENEVAAVYQSGKLLNSMNEIAYAANKPLRKDDGGSITV